MNIKELLDQLNQSKRPQLVKFLQERNFTDTKIQLVEGELQSNNQMDKGTISLALCSHYIYDKSGQTWDFIVITDKMATKDADEEFNSVSMDAEVVRFMLPNKSAEINFESNSIAEKAAALSVRVEILQERFNGTKEAYDSATETLKEYHKEIMELSAWKIDHSGNYRNAGRPRRFDKFEQGHSIYVMHDKELLSFRRIAELMNMSYSSARRLYQEYIEFQKQYGNETDKFQNGE